MIHEASKRAEIMKHAYLCFILFFAFVPLFIMVVVSFKTNEQYQVNPWFFDSIDSWHWENWVVAWGIVKNYIANSIVTSVSAVGISMGMVILTSYVLARYRFPGCNIIYYGILASMFLPGTVATLVTLFELLKDMGLINRLMALIVVGASSGQIAGIFILRQFIEEIPRDLFESAEIDGAGHFQQIRHIVLPMSGSILATISIMSFLEVWNNIMLPLVVMRDDEKLTIPVGLMRLEGEYIKQWGEMMAGYTLASIPLVILFVFTMRWFVKGLAAGAIKG